MVFLFGQAYTVKTPTKVKVQPRENKNASIEENAKKRKMVFEFDINSDSSESADLLVNTLQIISIYYLFILSNFLIKKYLYYLSILNTVELYYNRILCFYSILKILGFK